MYSNTQDATHLNHRNGKQVKTSKGYHLTVPAVNFRIYIPSIHISYSKNSASSRLSKNPPTLERPKFYIAKKRESKTDNPPSIIH